MMKHTPYDGSHPLFRIGLEPLQLKDWIEVDEHIDFYLNEKARIKQLYGDKVFVAEANTLVAQSEALALLLDHVLSQHSATHRREGDVVLAGNQRVDLAADLPPLEVASQLLQEDLLLMRQGESGWRLVAASLCFPSSWTLLEKFGKPLDEIHQPVPGFGPGSRNAGMIFRIFDNLKVDQPVRRLNWSIYSDNELFHDNRNAENLKKQDFRDGIFMRVEHQTLRKLPVSGDILFMVRIHLDAMEKLRHHPDCKQICEGAIKSLQILDPDQLVYKGLTQERDRLIEKLDTLRRESEAA